MLINADLYRFGVSITETILEIQEKIFQRLEDSALYFAFPTFEIQIQ